MALSGYAIALVIRGAPSNEIILVVVGVVASAILRGLFQYLKEITGHLASVRVQAKMRRELYQRALILGPGALDQKRAGDVLVSLVEGVDQLETYYGEYLPQMGVAALTPIGIFIFMAFLDVPTAAIYLGLRSIHSGSSPNVPPLEHGQQCEATRSLRRSQRRIS